MKTVKIETMLEFLKRMHVSQNQDDRKYRAMARTWTEPPSVVEYFDDGKGHSGALTREETPVEHAIFNEAVSKKYITGLLMPGYVSKNEFVLSAEGRGELFRLLKEKEKTSA